jgi:hypothetical protein
MLRSLGKTQDTRLEACTETSCVFTWSVHAVPDLVAQERLLEIGEALRNAVKLGDGDDGE